MNRLIGLPGPPDVWRSLFGVGNSWVTSRVHLKIACLLGDFQSSQQDEELRLIQLMLFCDDPIGFVGALGAKRRKVEGDDDLVGALVDSVGKRLSVFLVPEGFKVEYEIEEDGQYVTCIISIPKPSIYDLYPDLKRTRSGNESMSCFSNMLYRLMALSGSTFPAH
jgi:hypothetical protein